MSHFPDAVRAGPPTFPGNEGMVPVARAASPTGYALEAAGGGGGASAEQFPLPRNFPSDPANAIWNIAPSNAARCDPDTATNFVAVDSYRAYWVPVVFGRALTITGIGIRLEASSVGNVVALGVYSSSAATGYPADRIGWLAGISMNGLTPHESVLAAPWVIPAPGLYWFAANPTAFPAIKPLRTSVGFSGPLGVLPTLGGGTVPRFSEAERLTYLQSTVNVGVAGDRLPAVAPAASLEWSERCPIFAYRCTW